MCCSRVKIRIIMRRGTGVKQLVRREKESKSDLMFARSGMI